MTQVERVTYLDGLRGVAAVMVVIHHMMIGFYPSTYTLDPNTVHTKGRIEYLLHNTPLGIGINGGLAVAIFLVLSGFIVGLGADKSISLAKLWQNGAKRFGRFFSLILVTHILVVGLMSLGWYWNNQAGMISGSDWWLAKMWQFTPSWQEAISQALGALFRVYDLSRVYNSSTWTMPLFFLGPLGILALSWICHKQQLRNMILAMVAIVLRRTNYWPIIVGYLLAQGFRLLPKKLPWPMVGALVIVGLWLGNYPQAFSTAAHTDWYRWLPILPFAHTSLTYHTLAAVALLTLVETSLKLQKILSWKLMVFLGKISFSLYLFHILVINSVMSGLVVELSNTSLSYTVVFAVSALLSWPIILGGSILLYRFVEMPIMKLINRVLQ